MSKTTELMMRDRCRTMIKIHEGYRNRVYVDTVGVPTGGYGHAFHVGSSLPKWIWEIIFVEVDFPEAVRTAERLIEEFGVEDLSPGRKAVLIDMSFNLGYDKLKKFKRTWQALKDKDYNKAAEQMLNSKWARQVGKRATRLAFYMRTGRLSHEI